MTREEIEAMEPGRELDRFIRIHLFGDIDETWIWFDKWGEHWITDNKEVPRWFELPNYSTDLSAAFEVLEKMRERKIYLDIRVWPDEYQVLPHLDENNKLIESAIVKKQSLPEAICKASLLAVLEG